MQEDIENRTLTLIVSGTKFTGRLLKAALSKYLAYCKERKQQKSRDSPVHHKGKQTVKQLVRQNQGVSNIEVDDPGIRAFERVARSWIIPIPTTIIKKITAFACPTPSQPVRP